MGGGVERRTVVTPHVRAVNGLASVLDISHGQRLQVRARGCGGAMRSSGSPGTFDRLLDQLCRSLDRRSDHVARRWAASTAAGSAVGRLASVLGALRASRAGSGLRPGRGPS